MIGAQRAVQGMPDVEDRTTDYTAAWTGWPSLQIHPICRLSQVKTGDPTSLLVRAQPRFTRRVVAVAGELNVTLADQSFQVVVQAETTGAVYLDATDRVAQAQHEQLSAQLTLGFLVAHETPPCTAGYDLRSQQYKLTPMGVII